MCMWAMENVRKKEQKRLSKKFRIYFKRSKQLLMKEPKDLTGDEMDRLASMLERVPRSADAYRVKSYALGLL